MVVPWVKNIGEGLELKFISCVVREADFGIILSRFWVYFSFTFNNTLKKDLL